MDENTRAKFDEKMKELLNIAKKKKNVLEYQEINDFFSDLTLDRNVGTEPCGCTAHYRRR